MFPMFVSIDWESTRGTLSDIQVRTLPLEPLDNAQLFPYLSSSNITPLPGSPPFNFANTLNILRNDDASCTAFVTNNNLIHKSSNGLNELCVIDSIYPEEYEQVKSFLSSNNSSSFEISSSIMIENKDDNERRFTSSILMRNSVITTRKVDHVVTTRKVDRSTKDYLVQPTISVLPTSLSSIFTNRTVTTESMSSTELPLLPNTNDITDDSPFQPQPYDLPVIMNGFNVSSIRFSDSADTSTYPINDTMTTQPLSCFSPSDIFPTENVSFTTVQVTPNSRNFWNSVSKAVKVYSSNVSYGLSSLKIAEWINFVSLLPVFVRESKTDTATMDTVTVSSIVRSNGTHPTIEREFAVDTDESMLSNSINEYELPFLGFASTENAFLPITINNHSTELPCQARDLLHVPFPSCTVASFLVTVSLPDEKDGYDGALFYPLPHLPTSFLESTVTNPKPVNRSLLSSHNSTIDVVILDTMKSITEPMLFQPLFSDQRYFQHINMIATTYQEDERLAILAYIDSNPIEPFNNDRNVSDTNENSNTSSLPPSKDIVANVSATVTNFLPSDSTLNSMNSIESNHTTSIVIEDSVTPLRIDRPSPSFAESVPRSSMVVVSTPSVKPNSPAILTKPVTLLDQLSKDILSLPELFACFSNDTTLPSSSNPTLSLSRRTLKIMVAEWLLDNTAFLDSLRTEGYFHLVERSLPYPLSLLINESVGVVYIPLKDILPSSTDSSLVMDRSPSSSTLTAFRSFIRNLAVQARRLQEIFIIADAEGCYTSSVPSNLRPMVGSRKMDLLAENTGPITLTAAAHRTYLQGIMATINFPLTINWHLVSNVRNAAVCVRSLTTAIIKKDILNRINHHRLGTDSEQLNTGLTLATDYFTRHWIPENENCPEAFLGSILLLNPMLNLRILEIYGSLRNFCLSTVDDKVEKLVPFYMNKQRIEVIHSMLHVLRKPFSTLPTERTDGTNINTLSTPVSVPYNDSSFTNTFTINTKSSESYGNVPCPTTEAFDPSTMTSSGIGNFHPDQEYSEDAMVENRIPPNSSGTVVNLPVIPSKYNWEPGLTNATTVHSVLPTRSGTSIPNNTVSDPPYLSNSPSNGLEHSYPFTQPHNRYPSVQQNNPTYDGIHGYAYPNISYDANPTPTRISSSFVPAQRFPNQYTSHSVPLTPFYGTNHPSSMNIRHTVATPSYITPHPYRLNSSATIPTTPLPYNGMYRPTDALHRNFVSSTPIMTISSSSQTYGYPSSVQSFATGVPKTVKQNHTDRSNSSSAFLPFSQLSNSSAPYNFSHPSNQPTISSGSSSQSMNIPGNPFLSRPHYYPWSK